LLQNNELAVEGHLQGEQILLISAL
jgi:hypothetical protein